MTYYREVRGGRMQIGDLVKLRPKSGHKTFKEEYHGLLIDIQDVGRNGSKTTLYDILVGDINQLLTVSDIFFNVWRIDDQR